ncbi:MAG: potassium channel family protein [Oscillospiraceae bacterium]
MRSKNVTVVGAIDAFFKHGADFSSANFIERDIYFKETIFDKGVVCFSKANCNQGKVNFRSVNFGDYGVDFNRASFGNRKNVFNWAKFGKSNVSFKNANFNDGRVHFVGAKFEGGNVDFSFVRFGNGGLNFNAADFGKGNVTFHRAHFGEENLSFLNITVNSLTFSLNVFRGHTDLRVKVCSYLTINDCVIEKTIKMEKQENCQGIKEINLIKTKNLGQIFIRWNEDNIKKLIYSQDSNHKQKAEQFLLLKENFHNIGRYDDEDKAYLEYKRCVRKSKSKNEDNLGFNGIWYKVRNPFEWLIADVIGHYGTNPVRVFISMICTVFLFAVLYTHLGIILPDKSVFESGFLSCLYYSCITFLTIGYGDLLPASYKTAFAASTEGFCGVFLMSYFTVSFVRKILR